MRRTVRRPRPKTLQDLYEKFASLVTLEYFNKTGKHPSRSFQMIHFGFRALMSCKRFGFSKVSTTLSRGWNLYRPFLLKDEWVTSDSRLPKIDLLFVATRKDFSTLGFALVNAQKGSKNEIEKITIIVPSDDVVECKRLLKHLNTKDLAPVAVIDETVLIAAEVSQSLRDKFGARFGWILQQLLKVSNILKSEAAGVLVVDADTVLLKERTGSTALEIRFYSPAASTTSLTTPSYTASACPSCRP